MYCIVICITIIIVVAIICTTFYNFKFMKDSGLINRLKNINNELFSINVKLKSLEDKLTKHITKSK